jgi:hypothetical protein
MSEVISEAKALKIVHEFYNEILKEDENGILALYVIGSLGGGYFRPGQSDIDTVIIVRDEAKITQQQIDDIAEKYHQKYEVPKGFGSIMIHNSEFSPPYTKSEIDFEFTIEIARLKTQGKAVFGTIDIDSIKMPTKDDFIKDALIMERWFGKEFGYPMFDKLQITGCVNTILGCLRRFLIIEKGVFEFNKFLTIDTYLQNNPPIINEQAFTFIRKKLKDEIAGNDDDLAMLRECGIQFRDFFNMRLFGVDSRTL